MERLSKPVLLVAMAIGIAGGSYGIASAATGSSSGTTSTADAAAARARPNAAATDARRPWGGRRSDETLLTDGSADKVRQASLAEVDGGTIVRVETDADGHAAYEAHMIDSDGSPVTVYVDRQFDVVSVERR